MVIGQQTQKWIFRGLEVREVPYSLWGIVKTTKSRGKKEKVFGCKKKKRPLGIHVVNSVDTYTESNIKRNGWYSDVRQIMWK